jgi:alanine racemase
MFDTGGTPVPLMIPSSHVMVEVDLARIRQNAQSIASRTGVEVIAVVKADAYGLGARRVAEAIGDIVGGFYFFDAAEVFEAKLWEVTDRRALCLLGTSEDAGDYLSVRIQPVVWTADRAAKLKRANPIVSLDTGQQRFACGADELLEVMEAGDCREVMTHASDLDQVRRFRETIETKLSTAQRKGLRLHAAGSALLNDRDAWFDAVRPGLALYRDAVRVSTMLVEAKDSVGPAGYTGFSVPRFGVILAGYLQGLGPGLCMVNGRRQRILEVGMQSAFVEIEKSDRVGDVVRLLWEGLDVEAIAEAWNVRPQEVLIRLTRAGDRVYRS